MKTSKHFATYIMEAVKHKVILDYYQDEDGDIQLSWNITKDKSFDIEIPCDMTKLNPYIYWKDGEKADIVENVTPFVILELFERLSK